MNYLTYSYLLTPLHTGASTQAGNLLGIAREAQTELPYIPSSSLRGKLRSSLESIAEIKSEAGSFFGERIKDGQQPTEGEVWFADATLLFFPVGSFSHQFLWITCPLWLSRWGRWLRNDKLNQLIEQWQSDLLTNGKKAITSASGKQIYLQGAILNEDNIKKIDISHDWDVFKDIPDGNGILDLKNKLVILSNEDCGAVVEIGLQREVRIALDENEKIVAGGSFRSEEAIPSETIMFFPWGMKPEKEANKTHKVREFLIKILNDRLQFGGLEGLGRGWTENQTIAVNKKEE
ncbi:type III-B CRISPR module RAMP protein Cmr4 [Dolichospermum circinale CS-1225]|uniref:Type III-B CRISPR module RAMP protein Cmr4 n=1 Tax=Sphaerospermopsis aphanizomenoides LEGE 00250 TaxID=2777972 RepID=A0ABR9VJP7_9CYAN|nr:MULTISPECIES: type III-B CRISPR module RAMP protein Cmr4 [Aphanizomenonaceae]MBD2146415.1 type III-B CRISPR module RAMP protein Cmr4 [Sphaerospermopsis sp. FACHB-1194]MBE9237872.1 type III-B CRISPR module RAMP protein Cmr4 [Sphaerospermopsis aphanizomenoides LEGE 00250]MDB9523622.1 type III-B CRISPR module RAMP protein Cmr4 [Dolichospermum circinale CS-1225]